ncbi:Arm DNA-binding domain-containing protein [Mesorhizobium australicum]|uniref:Arm DNA-binding domain-containing protein n=1 Tax=Mesorhizobium australicum TaxID=536018 RepID=UPI001FCCC127|nr:Arm DNA-binding domain-containing protein [Mesorhizobium australicum]
MHSLKSESTARKVSDGSGLRVLITPQGSRLWRLAYRYGGKQMLLALGAYPAVSLSDALERRAQAKRLLAGGIDPSVEAKQE